LLTNAAESTACAIVPETSDAFSQVRFTFVYYATSLGNRSPARQRREQFDANKDAFKVWFMPEEDCPTCNDHTLPGEHVGGNEDLYVYVPPMPADDQLTPWPAMEGMAQSAALRGTSVDLIEGVPESPHAVPAHLALTQPTPEQPEPPPAQMTEDIVRDVILDIARGGDVEYLPRLGAPWFQKENGEAEGEPPVEETDCVDDPDPSYIKITPVSGVSSIRVLKKIAVPKTDEKTGKTTEEKVDTTGFPHWVYLPKVGVVDQEWKVEFKYCECLTAEKTVVVQGVDATYVQPSDGKGYAGEIDEATVEKNTDAYLEENFKLTKSDVKCCPDGKTQMYWYCGTASWTIKVRSKKGRRIQAIVFVGGKKKLEAKARQGSETGDEGGDWENVK